MMQQLIHMTGANEQKTKALTEQVSEMGAKTNIISRRSKRLAWHCCRSQRGRRQLS